jgi:hypothetical protein
MHCTISKVVEKEIWNKDKTVKQQFPVYFVSEVLTGSKKFYSEIEKICYAVIMSSRKLRHYFEEHNKGPNQSATKRYFQQQR